MAVGRKRLLSQRAIEAVEHIPEVIIFPDIHLAAGWLLGIDAAQASGIVQGQNALQAAKVGQHCCALVELTIRLTQLGGKVDQAVLELHPAELSYRSHVSVAILLPLLEELACCCHGNNRVWSVLIFTSRWINISPPKVAARCQERARGGSGGGGGGERGRDGGGAQLRGDVGGGDVGGNRLGKVVEVFFKMQSETGMVAKRALEIVGMALRSGLCCCDRWFKKSGWMSP